MYTGPGRLTQLWRKVRSIPPAVQGAVVLVLVVLVAFGAAHSRSGSSGPSEIITPSTSPSASALDTSPSATPSISPDQTSSPEASATTEATEGPSGEPSGEPTSTEFPSVTPTPTGAVFMYSDCKEIKAAGRDPLSRGEYGYNPALDRDHDGVDCH